MTDTSAVTTLSSPRLDRAPRTMPQEKARYCFPLESCVSREKVLSCRTLSICLLNTFVQKSLHTNFMTSSSSLKLGESRVSLDAAKRPRTHVRRMQVEGPEN
ncbi:hypothetical protein EYF80_048064 [Liparis tanakae]|uniref:Uncharacterized protein n=1 Tax=Liparis tanakae TaxID=230148 RepID=A0A4Z2FKI2_9TELE|nr:hypothetical protein EYF80_048064 [Liparis tanakae]